MPIEKEELKTMLGDFKTKVEDAIALKTKEVSDSSAKEIKDLNDKLVIAEKALKELQEQSKKSFGLPGVELEKEKFNWSKYFVGLFKNYQASISAIDASAAKNYWDTEAAFESKVCKDYSSSDGSSGGVLVPPQIYQGDVIDTVYANVAIQKMPVMRFTGLKGDMPIPVDQGNLTAYHVGETEAPAKTESTFKLEWVRPKKIGVYVRVSERLLYQTNNAIEMIVKTKMTLDAAVKMSYGLTAGKGSESEPKGILQDYSRMTGTKTISTNGRRWSIDDLAAQKMALASANELRDSATYGTIMHPNVLWGMLRERTEMYSSQAAAKQAFKLPQILIDQASIQNALKLSIEATTQIPLSTCGTSSTCSKVITGDWSKFAVATFRDPIFRISREATDSTGRSALLNDEVFMVMFLEYDGLCTRPSSFCGFDGAETLESNW
jgi:HK97 family phage major capsid protein